MIWFAAAHTLFFLILAVGFARAAGRFQQKSRRAERAKATPFARGLKGPRAAFSRRAERAKATPFARGLKGP
jgi:hypothetical protein